MSYVDRSSVLAIGVTFIPLSLMVVLVLGACGVVTHSLGTHTLDIGPAVFTVIDPSYQLVKKLQYVIYLLYTPALVLMKLSILFFYRRMFRGNAFTISFWVLSVFSVVWGVAFFTAFAAACPGVQGNFTSILTLKTRRVDTFKIVLVQSVSDIIADLAILILPIPFVFALQIPLKRKIAVSCTLVFGALAISCGTARMVVFFETLALPLFSTAIVAGLKTDDAKGIVSALCIWSVLEMNVGTVAICLSTLRPLLKTKSLESTAHSCHSVISLRTHTSSKRTTSINLAETSSQSEERNDTFVASATFDNEKVARSAHGQQEQNVDRSKIMVEKTVSVESTPR